MSKKRKEKSGDSHHSLYKGKLEITKSGIGYVIIDDKSADVLVRPGDFNTALNGDTVRVKVTRENFGTKRREGKNNRSSYTQAKTEFVGTLQKWLPTLLFCC